jgi:hypothetical protein
MTNETASVVNVLHDLVIADRAFSSKGVMDNFGHVSARHPSRADRFFLCRSRSPSLVMRDVALEADLVTPDRPGCALNGLSMARSISRGLAACDYGRPVAAPRPIWRR